MKLNPRVSQLALYDIRLGKGMSSATFYSYSSLTSFLGVAADVSHINTKSTVQGYDPTPSGLRECLSGAEIVLIPAGVPRKPGMTRDG